MTSTKGYETNMPLKIRRLLVTSLLALFCCSLSAGVAEPQIMETAKEKRKDRSSHEPKHPKPPGKSNVEKGKPGNPNKLAGSMASGNGTRPEPAGKQEHLQKKDTKPPDGPPSPCDPTDQRPGRERRCNETKKQLIPPHGLAN